MYGLRLKLSSSSGREGSYLGLGWQGGILSNYPTCLGVPRPRQRGFSLLLVGRSVSSQDATASLHFFRSSSAWPVLLSLTRPTIVETSPERPAQFTSPSGPGVNRPSSAQSISRAGFLQLDPVQLTSIWSGIGPLCFGVALGPQSVSFPLSPFYLVHFYLVLESRR